MKVYYDGLFTELVPVSEPMPAEGQNHWTAKVTADTKHYRRGDTVTDFQRQFVHKAGVRNGFIMVRTWVPLRRWLPPALAS